MWQNYWTFWIQFWKWCSHAHDQNAQALTVQRLVFFNLCLVSQSLLVCFSSWCRYLVSPKNIALGISPGFQETSGVPLLLWVLSQHVLVITRSPHLVKDPACVWGWRGDHLKSLMPSSLSPNEEVLHVSVFIGDGDGKLDYSPRYLFQLPEQEKFDNERWRCYQGELVCPLMSRCFFDGVSCRLMELAIVLCGCQHLISQRPHKDILSHRLHLLHHFPPQLFLTHQGHMRGGLYLRFIHNLASMHIWLNTDWIQWVTNL